MKAEIQELVSEKKNFVFIGGAGSGKSEISINFAIKAAKLGNRPVHLFDLDMTKPLFRSRDLEEVIEAAGVHMHYQEQFMDAPTLVGGVRPLLKDKNNYTVLDIGGDYIGARAIGGYARLLDSDDTVIYYVLNSHRPWTDSLEHIDETLSKILEISHINLDRIKFISNPNNGSSTTEEEIVKGNDELCEMLGEQFLPEFICVKEDLCDGIEVKVNLPVFSIRPLLPAEWLKI